MTEKLFGAVRRWIENDPDAKTRSGLERLLQRAEASDASATEELQRLFAGRLAFGTAGLRAELGPGPLRMNRLVVRQTAAGMLSYAQEQLASAQQKPDSSQESMRSATPKIVIGFDARHQSDEFAADTAEIFSAAGWEVHLFTRPGPTPLLARQVLVLDAEIGVMVTASHNPPQDNGYKVYLGGELSRFLEPDGHGVGAQIVPPVDQDIAARIAELVDADTPSRADGGSDGSTHGGAPETRPITDEARDSYEREALELLDPETYPHRDLHVVYSAMHGVGGEMVTSLLRAGGFTVTPVAEQHEPDPDFPTADFPNPEEPGALDLALKAAEANHADLVLANDPDADRLSAAVYDESASAWRQLSGDEIGALLGRHLLERGPLRPQAGAGAPVLANSIVSSRLLERLCQVRGVGHAATLTGFKWLARVQNMSFGYEEAIGFNVDPEHVKDKDGVSAALIFAEMTASLKARGISLIAALDEIAAEAGVFVTGQVTIRVSDLSELGKVTAALRAQPPEEIAGSAVVESLDLTQDPLPGTQLSGATKTDALIYLTADGDRVIVRPSGTEPKVKCYLEAVAETPGVNADPEAIGAARAQATARLEQLRSSMESMLG
ncbi:phospho-sugar mutase [Nesterenkonia sp. E16_7]|uniref:phospho-sugar mutase n=1 Tax=unclassified Nesterenkonia TaxID=2629769 RepID=UPI001A9259D8|nr:MULTISPECIES: phospho-sugar mutase [unclassified Nesterenkonia]MBO0596530.1 phospho-sugar mutase [Nesterenkonia sp. E16_10]MBO0597201.1 phospho-sugar mutase [Nesterenkonia sp. E16_7]